MKKEYGYFTKSGYRITERETPRHWYNYLYNDEYITFVSQVGFGQGFAQDEMGRRIQVVDDRAVYLVEGKDFWQATGVTFESKYDGCQDLDVSRRLMREAKTVRYVDDIILTWYHPREGSISTEWPYPMMRNYWRLATDMFWEASIELSSQEEYLWEQYKQKIVRDSGTSLWRVNAYSNEQQRELGKIIRPIRPYFSYKYAPDKRTAFLFLAVKYLGVRNAALIVANIRKLKHIALGR